ncbi:MAG TPA: polysaccharide deacetylase family protein [Gaiellaceae bacterium]|nr:polysaccharide deacetylase family protein [Gaiellaceae bacterium]
MRPLAALAAVAAVLALPARAGDRLRPVPILMYHVLSAPPANAPYPELYVRPADFRGEVAWLAAHGYTAVTLRRVFDAWRGAATLPAKPVVLSFDDGYLSHVRTALPALKARRWPGVLNLEVANLKPVWGIRPPGVRRLLAAGWELDSHTLTHPDLTAVGATRLREEVTGSRTAIRTMFHVPVDFFCYPAGRYDAGVVAAVQRAGYLGATTTRYGQARPGELYTLARVRVNGTDGVRGLAAKLAALSS